MRIVVTGGGTGGHVFPALETALGARDQGWDVSYFGSHRGQEGGVCEKANLDFKGFPSQPIYKIYTPAGLKAVLQLLKASKLARKALDDLRPHAVFSTGGYSSAPVVQAAKRLGIPFVIHEQNSVPGRTNKMMSQHAFRVCTVFFAAVNHFPNGKVVRTGLPVRSELRQEGQGRLSLDGAWIPDAKPTILVMGGSQGSAALNDVAFSTALRMTRDPMQWIHLTGTKHFEAAMKSKDNLGVKGDYDVRAFLDATQMGEVLFASTLAVCRSGAGTLSELAAFRKPSVLIPYPHAHAQHQLHNAKEFEAMGAAEVIEQSNLHADGLEGRILSWLHDKDRMAHAQKALSEWDILDSVPRILSVLQEAASKP